MTVASVAAFCWSVWEIVASWLTSESSRVVSADELPPFAFATPNLVLQDCDLLLKGCRQGIKRVCIAALCCSKLAGAHRQERCGDGVCVSHGLTLRRSRRCDL